MRRMYSEQELTNVIKEVFEAELASGALDENVSDAVDAYLVEHPVDITALEGQDVELNSLDATGLITGGEIVEKMSGYSFVQGSKANLSINTIYAGAVKNGNKLTLVMFQSFIRSGEIDGGYATFGAFTLPYEVASKIYPYVDTIVAKVKVWLNDSVSLMFDVYKNSTTTLTISTSGLNNILTLDATYVARVELTFLLSENLSGE